MFEQIEHLMHADMFGLELLGMLIFRMAFMLNHQRKKCSRKLSDIPPSQSMLVLNKRLPKVGDVSQKNILYFLDVLALNEDVKVHTLGHENAKYDYGRINTLTYLCSLNISIVKPTMSCEICR